MPARSTISHLLDPNEEFYSLLWTFQYRLSEITQSAGSDQRQTRYDYDCFYAKSERHSYLARHEPPPRLVSPSLSSKSSHDDGFVTYDSQPIFKKTAFTEFDSDRTDWRSSTLKSQPFAWNLALRSEPRAEEIDFTQYLSLNEFQRLSEVFFNMVHPIFNFFDRTNLEKRAMTRYSPRWNDRSIDPIICGVAALGSFFSIGSTQSSHQHESELVELAKCFLDHSVSVGALTEDDIVAWILRTIYLRATCKPLAAWLSSGTTMQIIEGMCLHQDTTYAPVPALPTEGEEPTESERRRRIFWIAKSLNILISFEYNRSPVKLCHSRIQHVMFHKDVPTPTEEFIALATLIPTDEFSADGPDYFTTGHPLSDALDAINSLPASSADETRLLKASLALTIYRRLRQASCSSGQHAISPEITSTVIHLGLEALLSASSLSARRVPWWAVASVPFQLVCVLLAVDSRESLARVGETMSTLEDVGRNWADSKTTGDTVQLARRLVAVSRRRKVEDLRWLGVGDHADHLVQTTTAGLDAGDAMKRSHCWADDGRGGLVASDMDVLICDNEADENGYLENPCSDEPNGGTVSPKALQLPSPVSPRTPDCLWWSSAPPPRRADDHGLLPSTGQTCIDWDQLFSLM